MSYKRDTQGRFVKGTNQPHGFKEGHKPWNKGKSHTEEAKEKMAKSSKGKVLVYPDLNFSDSLSYIIGVVLGDGFVDVQNKVGLHQKREEFAKDFKKALKEINLNPFRYSPPSRDLIRIEASSLAFAEWFRNLKIKEIEELVMEYPIGFLKGLYEAEGQRADSALQISITEKWLLTIGRKALRKLDFRSSLTLRNQRTPKTNKLLYDLRVLGGFREWNRFLKEMEPCIKNRRWEERNVKFDRWNKDLVER